MIIKYSPHTGCTGVRDRQRPNRCLYKCFVWIFYVYCDLWHEVGFKTEMVYENNHNGGSGVPMLICSLIIRTYSFGMMWVVFFQFYIWIILFPQFASASANSPKGKIWMFAFGVRLQAFNRWKICAQWYDNEQSICQVNDSYFECKCEEMVRLVEFES